MARNTSISSGDHFVEPHESQVLALQEALGAGEGSGAAVFFDSASFLKRMRASHAR